MKLRDVLGLIQQSSSNYSKVYLCGGIARDKYMKNLENIADIDVTSGDDSIFKIADEFESLISEKYNYKRKILPDNHSTFTLGNLKIDFSSNFVTPDIEKILNRSLTNMEKELFSRDFTCNTLLMSLDLKHIYDVTNLAVKDIKNKVIKTCLPPEITLVSNRNRVIRSIYMACKLNFTIDDSIIEFVKANPDSLNLSSEKAIKEKLSQSFEKNPEKAKYYIQAMGLQNLLEF